MPEEPQALVLATERRGPHHVIQAAVTGRQEVPLVLSFVVDTGASEVTLPLSLLDELALDPAELEEVVVQTANGRIRVKRGRLQSIELGDWGNAALIEAVDALFVADHALGDMALMGMNVLGRYRMTIDDDNSEILLTPKPF